MTPAMRVVRQSARLLLAVPLAAIVAVLIRYGIRKYKESALYQGTVIDGPDGNLPLV